MSIIMPAKGQDFAPIPAGNHFATCYRVVDLGTQMGEYMGKPKIQHKIMISWELPEVPMEDGSPYSMHQRYTLSSSDKATLRKHLESWRGKPFTEAEFGSFDVGNLIGVNCLLNIVHEEKKGTTYANIASIGSIPKAMNVPLRREPTNKTVYFSLSNFDKAIYDGLSDGLKAIIAKSPEYQELMGAHRVEADAPDNHAVIATLDDEIPF